MQVCSMIYVPVHRPKKVLCDIGCVISDVVYYIYTRYDVTARQIYFLIIWCDCSSTSCPSTPYLLLYGRESSYIRVCLYIVTGEQHSCSSSGGSSGGLFLVFSRNCLFCLFIQGVRSGQFKRYSRSWFLSFSTCLSSIIEHYKTWYLIPVRRPVLEIALRTTGDRSFLIGGLKSAALNRRSSIFWAIFPKVTISIRSRSRSRFSKNSFDA